MDFQSIVVELPSVTHNASVFVNDHWVGQSGQFEPSVSRHHNEPLLFKFSSDQLHLGFNKINVRVKSSNASQGLLGQFYVAPASALQESFHWKHFVRVDFIQWLTLSMFVYAGLTLLFFIARPKDPVYGYFSALIFFWAMHNLNLFVNYIPVSDSLWEAMTVSTLGWAVVMMIMFNHRYLGSINRRIETLILMFSIAGLGIFFIPDTGYILAFGYVVWDSFLIIIGIYAQYYLLHAYIKHKNKDAYLLTLIGIPLLVLGLHDILVVNHLIDAQEGLIIQFSIVPTFLIFSWFLIRRFLYSINKAEQLAVTLERRVEEKQHSLEIQYKQINEFEKQDVLAKERERLMRDMHDGIGGQLISIVTILSEHKEPILVKIREKIQNSIGDLRFVIDSLDPFLNDFPTLLGTMRGRLSDQLSAVNIELEWAITDLPELESLTPSQSLHIMRIIQEAVTNSIKHSGTQRLKIATGMIEQETINNDQMLVFVDIIDYGSGHDGLNESTSRASRGLTNMKYRAEQLHARLDIDFKQAGTTVGLVLKIKKGDK